MNFARCLLAALLVLAGAHAMAQVGSGVDARLAAEDWAGAERLLRERLADAPDDDAARFQLARVLAWQQRAAEALPLYDALLAREPGNADYLFGRAQAQLWSGDRAAAQASVARLEAIAPMHPGLDDLRRQMRPEPSPSTLPAPGAERGSLVDGGYRVAPRFREIGVSARHEWLTRSLDPWQGQRLDVSSRGDGRGWYVAAARERRFGLVDSGLEAGVALPVAPRWTLQLDGGAWPGSDFQPRWFGDVRMQHAFEGGTVLAAGLRRTRYPEVTVERLALAVEQYVGDWRLGYTFNRTDVDGERVNGHDAAIDRYYGERDVIGLRLTAGSEDVLQGTQVVASQVRALALQGRHGLSDAWALQWGLGYVRQGDFHDRRWLQLGLRRAF
ncbi:YaiO family outer membrane beta-barrel protein [Luteimonas viscosa]|uniref:YaiO family outer membrane beta-barrel protein n=1 Tax=Luteimonas viscosa TaxID=1132694 RepID=A0A5D4XRK8_9GAMM|nr:YaiO family outer membrane beta-barrel protein [Luteimonas viscosa]TYT26583.1 YaiO family outer membrane beta-barrel protein [Luteimonas viscosa]